MNIVKKVTKKCQHYLPKLRCSSFLFGSSLNVKMTHSFVVEYQLQIVALVVEWCLRDSSFPFLAHMSAENALETRWSISISSFEARKILLVSIHFGNTKKDHRFESVKYFEMIMIPYIRNENRWKYLTNNLPGSSIW